MQVAPKVQAPEVPPETIAPIDIPLHRFGIQDLEPKGLWLYGRLHEIYPDIAQNFMAAWLRRTFETNGFLFLCAPLAVGLAQVNHRPLHSQPILEEIFVFHMDEEGAVEHALEIYRAMQRYAKGMDATDFIVGTATDVRQKDIVRALGPVKMKNVWTARVV